VAFDVVLEAGCGYAIESIDTGYERSMDPFILQLTFYSSGDNQDYPIVLFGEYLALSQEIVSGVDQVSEVTSLSYTERNGSFEGLSRSGNGQRVKDIELEGTVLGFSGDEESLDDEGSFYAHSLAKSPKNLTKEESELQSRR